MPESWTAIDLQFFATREGSTFQPIVKIRCESDKHFSLYLKSEVETLNEDYPIDEQGRILKN